MIEIAKIIFILSGALYFIYEGLNQTKVSTHYPNRYHKRRVFENLGLIIAFHIVFIATGWFDWIPLFWLTVGIGLPLYEFAFRKEEYGSFFHEKTGCWLGIKHPKIWVWIVLFVVSLIGLYLVI